MGKIIVFTSLFSLIRRFWVFLVLCFWFEHMINFTKNHDQTCPSNDLHPLTQRQWLDIEHPSAILHNQNLPNQYDRDDGIEHLAVLHIVERAVATAERFGIEQVPKLQEYECCEIDRHFVAGDGCMD